MQMRHDNFEHSIWASLLAPLLAALLAVALYSGRSQAATDPTTPTPARKIYIVNDYEGYGLVECISLKRECGKVVADSWCEAHGHGPALAFGGSDDVTGSSTDARMPKPPAGAALVSCSE
jgi:hypothetical protein